MKFITEQTFIAAEKDLTVANLKRFLMSARANPKVSITVTSEQTTLTYREVDQ